MFFTTGLYFALALFSLGLIYKVSTWFRYSLDTVAVETSATQRVFCAIKGIILTIFSAKFFILLKVFVFDVLLQIRILKESVFRWVMHMFIFWGFMLLLFMHALDKFITTPLFTDYYSTLNPFLFLRNLFAAMVIIGIILAAYRRFFIKTPRLFTNAMDKYAIIILAVIMISGMLLEGVKITSHTEFQIMVEDYAGLSVEDDEDEIKALESYWVQEYGVVSPKVKGPFNVETLELGKESLEMNCAECHTKPQWAFISYGVAKTLKPIAAGLDRYDFPTLFWYIHFMACFTGLAYLPFSKMFHIFVSPLSLLANAVMDKEKADPVNIATRQVMELDACTHCGACSLRCVVGVSFEEIGNLYILPSEKIAALKALAAGRNLSEQELRIIQNGLYLCTGCNRCTEVCPVGINLQDLWFNVREALLQKGHPEFYILSQLSFFRGIKGGGMVQDHYQKPLKLVKESIADEFKLLDRLDSPINVTHLDKEFRKRLAVSMRGKTSSLCFACKTCSSACPVVCNFDKPVESLGLIPHQVIHAANLGLFNLVFGSNMLWSCLGCYECQEHCPQGVRVADVFFELKNLAIKHFNEKASASQTG
jgi:heterodisulfide reductase subunit C